MEIKRQRQERIELRKWQHKQAQGFVPETLEGESVFTGAGAETMAAAWQLTGC